MFCGSFELTQSAQGSRCLLITNRTGALEKQIVLAPVKCELSGVLEFGAGFVVTAEPGQQIAAHTGEQVVGGQGGVGKGSWSTSAKPTAGP